MDKTSPSGFTIIEVILFFAVSSALMLGIITGITSSISRQRYNDTVNDFAEYLRSIYTEVQSVSNDASINPGRTNQAIYGKLLVFADEGKSVTSTTLTGLAVSQNFVNLKRINEDCSDSLSTLPLLGCTKIDKAAGTESVYTPIWDGKLESTAKNSSFSGCLLIVRSPFTGAVHTYYSASGASCSNFRPDDETKFNDYFPDYNNNAAVDICVNSDDNPNPLRRNIRIKEDAPNSSGVVIIELNSDTDNKCE